MNGFRGDAGEAEAGSDRHRRSALHFAVGPRFPARLPAAWRLSAHCFVPRRWWRSRRQRRRSCSRTSAISSALRTRPASSMDSAGRTSRSKWWKQVLRSVPIWRGSCWPIRIAGRRSSTRRAASRRRAWPRCWRRISRRPPIMPGSIRSAGAACRMRFSPESSR